MTTLLSLWESKTMLTNDEIDKALSNFSCLPRYKERDFLFVPSTVLHERRGHNGYLPHLKVNLERLGVFGKKNLETTNDNNKNKDKDKNKNKNTHKEPEYINTEDYLIFFALYKNAHFSVAVLDKSHGLLNHYDSLQNYNVEEFEHLNGILIDLGIIQHGDVSTHNVKFFEQNNSWECGYYSLLAMWAAYMNGVAVDTMSICSRKDSTEKVKKSMKFMLESLKFDKDVKGGSGGNGNKVSEDEYDMSDNNNLNSDLNLDLECKTPLNLIPEEEVEVDAKEGEVNHEGVPDTKEEGEGEGAITKVIREEEPHLIGVHKESSKKHTKKVKKHHPTEDIYTPSSPQDDHPTSDREEVDEVKTKPHKKKESRSAHPDKGVTKKTKREKEK